jgi:hypothetical protein
MNDTAPTTLSYNNQNIFTKNTIITHLTPTNTGGTIVSYALTIGVLPTSLSFSTSTGVISGIPT